MRPYQKWLSVGLLALTPGLAMAGALNSPILKPNQGAATAAARPAKKSRPAANQELADKIAKALRKSKLDGYDINIDVRDGVVILDGFVTRAEQRSAAAKAARAVPGVTTINNRLRIGDPASRPRADQSSAQPSRSTAMPVLVRTANYQSANDRASAIEQAAYESGPNGTTAQSAYPARGMTAYCPQSADAGYAVNQPYLPANAYPVYAQNQSSAGAWPYLGPFQPYPQCPLGWRKVSMYWDEGLWKLDFGSRKPCWQ